MPLGLSYVSESLFCVTEAYSSKREFTHVQWAGIIEFNVSGATFNVIGTTFNVIGATPCVDVLT